MPPDSWMDMAIIRTNPSLRDIEIECLMNDPVVVHCLSIRVIHAYVCCHSDEVLKWGLHCPAGN